MQIQLSESEAQFRLLAENSSDMISKHNTTGIFLYVSPACRTLLGYEPEELTGTSVTPLVHPEDAKQLIDLLASPEWNDITVTVDYRARHKSGEYIWIETTARLFFDELSGQQEFQASSRNITERKEAEEQLQRAHTDLQDAYDKTIEGWVLALDLRDRETEGHTPRVTTKTEELAQVLGFTEEEITHIRRGALLHDMGASIGAINNVISVSIERRIDESGPISFSVPATDYTAACLLSTAPRFRVDFSDGASSIYGIIDKDTINVNDPPTRTVNGYDMLFGLQRQTMGWWCLYDNKDIINDFLPDFIGSTGSDVWTLDKAGSTIYYSFDGDSWLAGLIKVAQGTGKHFRLRVGSACTIEWGDFFQTATASATNMYLDGYSGHGKGALPYNASMEVTSDKSPVINRIFPWGEGNDGGDTNRDKVSLFHLSSGNSEWANIKVRPGPRGASTLISAVGPFNGKANALYTVADSSEFFKRPVHQSFWCYEASNLSTENQLTDNVMYVIHYLCSCRATEG